MQKNMWHILAWFAIAGITLLPAVLDLDDFRAPDEDRWVANTGAFVTMLSQGRLSELLQLPHPGITTQWLGATTIHFTDWEIKKLPLVVGAALLILAIGYCATRLWGVVPGLMTSLLLATNPLLAAHIRVYAMDALLALFSLLSLLLLFLWQKRNKEFRYLVASGFTAAAAILSKLPGILLIPYAALVILLQPSTEKTRTWLYSATRTYGIWLLALIVSACLILPSLAITPLTTLHNFIEYFGSDAYQTEHPGSHWYYLRTIAFFTTPMHFLLLLTIPLLFIHSRTKKLPRRLVRHTLLLLLFATLFTLQMSLGSKAGDRYILPALITLDAALIAALTTLTRGAVTTWFTRQKNLVFVMVTVIALLQYGLIWQLHPHTLAYVNPITKSFFADRRHGWGEGLELAAQYLNTKENAAQLKVASYYPEEFGHHFLGSTVPIHQHDEANPDYVIIYRAMFERGAQAWETDVVNTYKNKQPEKTIQLGGLEMIWIYHVTDTQP